jgi:hypothetical protein
MVKNRRLKRGGADDEVHMYLNEIDNPHQGLYDDGGMTEEQIMRYKAKNTPKDTGLENNFEQIANIISEKAKKITGNPASHEQYKKRAKEFILSLIDRKLELKISRNLEKIILKFDYDEDIYFELVNVLVLNELYKKLNMDEYKDYGNIRKYVESYMIHNEVKLKNANSDLFKYLQRNKLVVSEDEPFVIGIGKPKGRKIKGGKFINDLFNPSKVLHELKKIPSLPQKAVKTVVDKVKDVFKPDYSNFPASAQKVLEERGNFPIISLEINRTPLGKPVQALINTLTLGTFEKGKKESGFDKFFHLALICTVRNTKGQNLQVVIMKNSRIDVTRTFTSDPNTEYLQVPLKGLNFTPNQMLEMTRKRLGDTKFFRYDSFTDNCQVLVKDLLTSIGLYGKKEHDFVYQDTLSVVKKIPMFNQQLLHFTTDMGNVFQKLTGTGKKRRTAPKLRAGQKCPRMCGGKLEKCPAGYTDFGLTCTRCTWQGCNTTSKINVAETVNEVKRGVSDAGKVVKRAFEKFGNMTKEAFVGIYDDIKKRHPDIKRIEDGFKTVVKAAKLTVANKDWWNKTMTTPDTYILLVSTAFTVASLAGVPAAGTLASATKILGDLAQGRPIKISDINSLALSLIPVPQAGKVINASMFDKVKTAMIGAKSMTAAQRAAIIGKNIVTASNALIDTYGEKTIPNVVVPSSTAPASTQRPYAIDDSNAELPNPATPEKGNPNRPVQPYTPPTNNIVLKGGRYHLCDSCMIHNKFNKFNKRGGRKIRGGSDNITPSSDVIAKFKLGNDANGAYKALKPCDAGYTDFGLTCTRCIWQGWELQCNTVSKVDWSEVSDDIRKAFQPLMDEFKNVEDLFNKYAGMTKELFQSLANQVQEFCDDFDIIEYEFFYQLEEELASLSWWKDVLTDPMTYIFLMCIICSGGTVLGLFGALSEETTAALGALNAVKDILTVIAKIARGESPNVQDIVNIILDFYTTTSTMATGASYWTQAKNWLTGANAADKSVIIGRYMLSILAWAEGKVTFNDFLASLEGTQNSQNAQEQANAANGVTPPPAPSNPPKPIPPNPNAGNPCKFGFVDDKGTRLFSKNDCLYNLNGQWYPDGECLKKDGTGSYSVQCKDTPDPNSTGWPCGLNLGTYNTQKDLMDYTQDECDQMGGVYNGNGECLNPDGGSYSYNCNQNKAKSKDPCQLGQMLPSRINGIVYRQYNKDECATLAPNGQLSPDATYNGIQYGSCQKQDGYKVYCPNGKGRPSKKNVAGGASNLVLHSVNIKSSVPLLQAQAIARDIMKTNKNKKHRVTKNYTIFRNIPKTKFQPKTYVTKKINKDVNIVLGNLK